MKKLIIVITVISGIFLSACNTMEGAGRDIEDAGESVQDAAN